MSKINRDLPEIRIKDAWLLRENVSQHLHELWAGDADKLAGDDDMQEIIVAYIKEWKRYEEEILSMMTGLLNLEFRKNIIDVYIAPWFYAFSDPLVMGVTFTPQQFVDQLTHEMIHILLTDNDKASIDSLGSPVGDVWARLFGDQHSFVTLVHIPVHAIHKR
ncbi:MAG: hypothetical protein ACK5LM_06405, partial [Lactovum sp.]